CAALEVGLLEKADEAIAQVDCITERLDRDGMRFRARHAVKARDRAERQHEMVKLDFVRMALVAVRDMHAAALEVDRVDLAAEEPGAPQESADRIHHVREIEVARSDLVEHGREEKEVLPRDERHFEIAAGVSEALELERRVHAAETATEDEH